MFIKAALLLCFLMSVSSAYPLLEDKQGEAFYLIPIYQRAKRQTTVGVEGAGGSTQVSVGHKGIILDNDIHRLDGSGSVTKTLHGPAPSSYQGQLDYHYKPTASELSIGATRTERFGTDVRAQGKANLWRHGDSRLDAVGSYGRHYGGPGGTGRPDAYAGLQFETKI